VMLFDCWTPAALRGRGYYGEAVSLIASRVKAAGKQPWIFSAVANVSSIRGLAKSGFQQRYSLVRQKALWWQRITRHPAASAETPVAEVSARI
jgi:predicted GNAT family acetyltransferase